MSEKKLLFNYNGYNIDLNLYGVAVYTTNKSGVVPTFNSEFTYTVHEVDNEDGTYTTTIAADNLDTLPSSISFNGSTNLLSVEKLNTSQVTDMSNMFQNCDSLTSLDLSSFDTSQVTDMSNMFYNCNLAPLDLSSWDTSNVTNMQNMFYGCTQLTELDLSSWDTSNVTNMQNMFYGCTSLKNLNLTNWSQGSVELMIPTLPSVTPTITLKGSVIIDETLLPEGWVYDNVLEVARYTANTIGLLPIFNAEFTYTNAEIDNGDGTYTTKISADSFDNLPNSISFKSKSNLLRVDKLNTSQVTNMYDMFCQCTELTSLDISSWDTSKVTSMSGMFQRCNQLTSLDLTGLNTSQVTNMGYMFQDCSNLISINGLDTWDTSQVTNMQSAFSYCTQLTELDVSTWDTSQVTTMQNMFESCNKLTSLNVSDWDTSQVTNMQNIFKDCKQITSLDVSDWDTSQVTNMNSMFYNCTSLAELDLSSWDTSQVANIYFMFYNCSQLTSLDLSSWDTSKVTNMQGVFSYCNQLAELDLTNWDTSQVTIMSFMFNNCNQLTSLDLSSWDTSNVTNMSNMFYGCTQLMELDVSNWSQDNVELIIPTLPSVTPTSTLLGTVDIGNMELSSGWVYSYYNPSSSFLAISDVAVSDTTLEGAYKLTFNIFNSESVANYTLVDGNTETSITPSVSNGVCTYNGSGLTSGKYSYYIKVNNGVEEVQTSPFDVVIQSLNEVTKICRPTNVVGVSYVLELTNLSGAGDGNERTYTDIVFSKTKVTGVFYVEGDFTRPEGYTSSKFYAKFLTCYNYYPSDTENGSYRFSVNLNSSSGASVYTTYHNYLDIDRTIDTDVTSVFTNVSVSKIYLCPEIRSDKSSFYTSSYYTYNNLELYELYVTHTGTINSFVNNTLSPTISSGGLSDTGVEENTSYYRTSYITLNTGMYYKLTFSTSSNYTLKVFYYDTDKTFISSQQWYLNSFDETFYIPTNATYMRVVISNNIALDTINSNMKIYETNDPLFKGSFNVLTEQGAIDDDNNLSDTTVALRTSLIDVGYYRDVVIIPNNLEILNVVYYDANNNFLYSRRHTSNLTQFIGNIPSNVKYIRVTLVKDDGSIVTPSSSDVTIYYNIR